MQILQPNREQSIHGIDIHSIDDSRFQLLQVVDVSSSRAKKVPVRALSRWMALSLLIAPPFCAIDTESAQSARMPCIWIFGDPVSLANHVTIS